MKINKKRDNFKKIMKETRFKNKEMNWNKINLGLVQCRKKNLALILRDKTLMSKGTMKKMRRSKKNQIKNNLKKLSMKLVIKKMNTHEKENREVVLIIKSKAKRFQRWGVEKASRVKGKENDF
jgi:hypothetical protein